MFLQLKVVVWKNFMIMTRHWVKTTFVCLSPILLFYCLIYFTPAPTKEIQYKNATYHNFVPIPYDLMPMTALYYTPNDEFHQDILERIRGKLLINKDGVKGFDSSEVMLQYYNAYHNNTVISVIAIIFNENGQKKLEYVIRDNWVLNYGEEQKSYGYKLSIQKALDISYIEKLSGNNKLDENIIIGIKPFPDLPKKIYNHWADHMGELAIVTFFSFYFAIDIFIHFIIDEKYTGIKEYMKIVGLKFWKIHLGWFIAAMIPAISSIICAVILLKVPCVGSEVPRLKYTDGTLLFTHFFLYYILNMAHCCCIVSFFNKPRVADLMVGLIVGFPVFILTQYLNLETSNLSQGSHLLIMLVPYMALYYGFSIIKIHEEIGLDLQWNNFHKSGDNFPNITIFNVFEMMLVDIILYMMLNCYIEAINPGQYGIRKPVLFPVYSVIKFVRKVFLKWKSPMELEPLHMGNVEEGRLLKKSIELYNINKKYGNKSVVHDLTLDIYQDQITVLLGHNGAGKTTTMLMMTGMIGATSGNIKINEKNIKTNMDELRKDIGLCTQHNLLFTDLTVGEHLGFIARLKGRTSKEAKEEIEFLLSKFNLINKKNELPRTLSGGMKRRLSLAMAIIGGSKILILDEPSSGLDPETRRIVWDLLLSLRAGKTILITTHSMEEADVLGDWIAIMAKGTLQCYGTPMYLKKKYNTGYHLTLVAVNGATQNDLNNIKANVVSQISKAQFKNLDGKNMTFVLPFGDNMMIAKLLSSLEDKKAELKIENISITVTTLEEVFLKTKGDIGTENENNIAMDFEDTESIIHNRKKLLILKIAALMKRNLQLYRRKLWTFMLMIFIGIIIFLFPLYIYLRKGNDLEEKEIKFDLHIYNESLAFYSGAQDGMIEKMKKFYKQAVEKYGGTAKKVVDVQQAIIDKGVENITYYMNHMVISAEFNSTDKTAIVTAFYNRDLKHSTPISLNLVTNAIAMAYLGEDYSISGSNWPLEDASNSTGLREKNMVILVNVAMMIPMGCFFILGSFIMFAQSERSTKFIQLQYLCGLKPYCYLMANLFTDLMVYVIIALILSVSMLLWAFINGLELWIIFVILFMYGLAGMPFVYLFSRMKSSFTSFQYFLYCSICLGIVLAIIFMLTKPHLEEDDYCSLKKFYRCKTIFMIFLPQFGLSYLIVTFFSKVLKNFETGYEKEDHWLYLEKDLNLMLASFFLYFVINILLDSYILKRFSHFARYGPVTSGSSDPHDVNPTNPHNLLTVKDLCKRYGRAKIVKNVSFSLKDGECLGILGVNGAGKTTIFHMLTREEIRNQGTIQIDDNGRVIDINQDEYLEKLGYCPQVDPLNYDLSARQILNLFARLRGASNPKIVNMFLKIFALEKYADLPCGHYSGGNKRKLSLGMALIGFPKCILLDEPTCGVDPFAKRNIWNLIKKVQESKNLSFILTSHSMAECEALCNNLIIMKNGIFEKQGTINNLKREYGGFSIKLKLVTKSDDEGGSMPSTVNKNSQKFNTVDELKQYFVKNYGAEIKDEHYSFLDLCIRDKSRKWSTIFKEVELIKSQNTHLIEDYVISEASLEDIFLSVARS